VVFSVICVFVCCLIVISLPQCKNPFEVQINNEIIIIIRRRRRRRSQGVTSPLHFAKRNMNQNFQLTLGDYSEECKLLIMCEKTQ
jgi:hypothetical protein